MEVTSTERFQKQFEKCFRRPIPPRTSKVLTGIEKEMAEREEARKVWRELESRDRQQSNG